MRISKCGIASMRKHQSIQTIKYSYVQTSKVINTRTWYSNTQVLKDWNIPMLLENSLPHWQLARRCKLRPEPVGWEWGWQQQQQQQ